MEITDASFIHSPKRQTVPGKNGASELLVSDSQPSQCSQAHLAVRPASGKAPAVGLPEEENSSFAWAVTASTRRMGERPATNP